LGFEDLEGKKEMFMHIALGIAFAMVAVAPFVGRWRANVWLRKNIHSGNTVKAIAKTA
jgi:hypothetical protein